MRAKGCGRTSEAFTHRVELLPPPPRPTSMSTGDPMRMAFSSVRRKELSLSLITRSPLSPSIFFSQVLACVAAGS